MVVKMHAKCKVTAKLEFEFRQKIETGATISNYNYVAIATKIKYLGNCQIKSMT